MLDRIDDVDAGLQRGELGAESRDALGLVEHRGARGELGRRVVRRRDPEARVLVADRLPRGRDVAPVARDAEHDEGVLGERRPDGFGFARCRRTVSSRNTNCVGTMTGTSRPLPDATRWPKA